MSSIEIASKTCKNRLKNEHFSSLHKTLAESLTEAALSHFIRRLAECHAIYLGMINR
jgi:hypothetical protein